MSTFPSSPAATKLASPPPTAKMPGETVRALVTLFLLFHLFGIAIALTYNPSAPMLPSAPAVDVELPNTSKLSNALRLTPVLTQYMYALWLDAPHAYRLTYADFSDSDHSVNLTLVYHDGHTEQQKFPPDDARGEERERYKALAMVLASPVYNESSDKSILAQIGQDLLEATGAKEVLVQIIRHDPLSMEDAQAGDPGLHDPNNKRNFVTIYSGTVTLNSLGQGEVHDLGEAARDVAPVTGPRGRSRSPVPPANNPSAPDAPPVPNTPSANSSPSTNNAGHKLLLSPQGELNDAAPAPPEKSN